MTSQHKEESLARLRKLWFFAMSQGNTKWAERIKTDAERIKNTADEDDTYERAKAIFIPDLT